MSTTVIHTRPSVSPKSRLIALLLLIFLGYLGVHRFYTGQICLGILYLCTGGFFGIGLLVDLILILTGTIKDERGLPISNWEETTPQQTTVSVSPGYQQQPYQQPQRPPRPQTRPPGPPPARPPPQDAFSNVRKNNKICTTCGSINELASTFCVSCGGNLE